jgi:hypothetical protein
MLPSALIVIIYGDYADATVASEIPTIIGNSGADMKVSDVTAFFTRIARADVKPGCSRN